MKIDIEGIKNIIFDFGDVICDIDFKRTVDAFSQLSENALEISVENYIHHPIFGGLEKGEISTEEFRDEIRLLLKTNASDASIDKAWARVIINTDNERIDMLRKLNTTFRIFLLSNTNAIHVATAFDRINKSFDVDFRSMFEEVYFSHLLKMAKPDAEIYNYVLNDAHIKANETLFIDDNKTNVEAAHRLGFKTYHLKPREEKVVDLFSYNN